MTVKFERRENESQEEMFRRLKETVDSLPEGTPVELPGTYTAKQLKKMGFDVPEDETSS